MPYDLSDSTIAEIQAATAPVPSRPELAPEYFQIDFLRKRIQFKVQQGATGDGTDELDAPNFNFGGPLTCTASIPYPQVIDSAFYDKINDLCKTSAFKTKLQAAVTATEPGIPVLKIFRELVQYGMEHHAAMEIIARYQQEEE